MCPLDHLKMRERTASSTHPRGHTLRGLNGLSPELRLVLGAPEAGPHMGGSCSGCGGRVQVADDSSGVCPRPLKQVSPFERLNTLGHPARDMLWLFLWLQFLSRWEPGWLCFCRQSGERF